ncbi:unnamed protein product, partial [Porites evermanni]
QLPFRNHNDNDLQGTVFQHHCYAFGNIRQTENNPEAEQFRAIPRRLRDGQTTQDDWITPSEDTTARKRE